MKTGCKIPKRMLNPKKTRKVHRDKVERGWSHMEVLSWEGVWLFTQSGELCWGNLSQTKMILCGGKNILQDASKVHWGFGQNSSSRVSAQLAGARLKWWGQMLVWAVTLRGWGSHRCLPASCFRSYVSQESQGDHCTNLNALYPEARGFPQTLF